MVSPQGKREMTMTNLNNELSIDELNAVSGGKVANGTQILSALCDAAGNLAHTLGGPEALINGLYTAAENINPGYSN
jgi:bacteriocin-like protein